MSLTNQDILDYILENRLFFEESEFLLQEKVRTMGADCVEQARTWIWGRFLFAAKTETWTTFIKMTFEDLTRDVIVSVDPTNNPVGLPTVRDAYAALLAGEDDLEIVIETYTMLFDALIKLAISYIWRAAHFDSDADKIEKQTQDLISAIVGPVANPDNVIGDGAGGDTPVTAPVIEVNLLTDAEISEELKGY